MEDFVGAVVGIIILLFAASWFIENYSGIFWTIVLVVICIFVARMLAKQAKADKARRAKEATQQLAYQRQILAACDESVVAFENIPKDLMTAEQLLDVADAEFQDSAFSPFWDSIERAMRKLGAVNDSIKLIADRSNQYKVLANSYNGRTPPFPVDPASAHRLGTANDTTARLQKIVRQAQRNFQFATIYEQRKTSKILIAGFTNIGEAIDGLGARLEQSISILGDQIDDLSSSMTAMNEKVVDAVKGVASAVGEVSSRVGDVSLAIKGADTNVQAAMADQAVRQEKAVRMLDNIQRRRVPPPLADT